MFPIGILSEVGRVTLTTKLPKRLYRPLPKKRLFTIFPCVRTPGSLQECDSRLAEASHGKSNSQNDTFRQFRSIPLFRAPSSRHSQALFCVRASLKLYVPLAIFMTLEPWIRMAGHFYSFGNVNRQQYIAKLTHLDSVVLFSGGISL